MSAFGHYIGVRYSGRKGPAERLDDLAVFSAREEHEPYVELNRSDSEGRWSRQELASWLGEKLSAEEPTVVGLDHAFSFPQSYMHRHDLGSWESFLHDFEEHWPTHRLSVRELLPGLSRLGESDEQRLTGSWTAFPRSVFQFDLKDSAARATHAGIPWLSYLKRGGKNAHFWPFDGFAVPAGRSVVAEVRPARLLHRYGRDGLSRDQHPAYAICAWLQDRDRLGLLTPYFQPPLSEAEMERARLEGWILGVA
ncbi:MAG TPA: hypothetical protein VMT16_02980 [Thermoanaerobaculia bacterium]|nr:hypothetical protein [Thermoanaerobaculia bacterium]